MHPVKVKRLASNMSLKTVGQQLGIDATAVSRIENWQRHMTETEIRTLAEIFKCKPDELMPDIAEARRLHQEAKAMRARAKAARVEAQTTRAANGKARQGIHRTVDQREQLRIESEKEMSRV